jgi:enamine deaminase RidA (YjgF/YER057c/UK114 family)
MLLVSEDIKDQTKQWLENILGIVLEAGRRKKEVWEENWGLGDYENK